jgi:hypothetical protein
MSCARTTAELLATIKGVPLEEFRAEAKRRERIRAVGEKLTKLPPTQWPALIFDWDCSLAAQHYVYDGSAPKDFAARHADGLVLGVASIAEIDSRLCKHNRRDDLDELWACGDASKLSFLLAYLQEGLPITPPLVSVANNELCIAGGNHRYTAAKFSGQKLIPIYVERTMTSAVAALVRVDWRCDPPPEN